MLPKWAWSGSREQFLHCGLGKFRHSKSSVDRWYTQLNVVDLFMTLETMGADSIASMVECALSITHCLRLNLQLHTIDLVRTCRISRFCTVAWQLSRFQLTRRIARSLGDSWAFCSLWCAYWRNIAKQKHYRPTKSRLQCTLLAHSGVLPSRLNWLSWRVNEHNRLNSTWTKFDWLDSFTGSFWGLSGTVQATLQILIVDPTWSISTISENFTK